MPRFSQPLIALLFGLSILSTSDVDIEIDYKYDTRAFFSENTANGRAARATIEAAAKFYSDILTDSLAPIESDVDTNDNYEVTFNHPSDFGTVDVPFLRLPADVIRIYVGSRNLGSALGFAGTGISVVNSLHPSASISGSREFQATAAFRGQDFGTEASPLPENAPWGGFITFNSRTDGLRGFWNYDHTVLPPFNNDLFSTALHEIGHVLGVGLAESYNSLVVEGRATFSGSRTMLFNRGQPLQLSGDTDHVGANELRTRLHPYASDSDETQLSAFLASRPISQRRHLTLLDAAILDDIGWDVNYLMAVPGAPIAAK